MHTPTPHPRPEARPHRQATGFTLVEILIVVIILAILAAIIVPQFSSASEEAREKALAANLWRIRQQIELYKLHHDTYPSLDSFVDQMTASSNEAGQTAPLNTDGYPFGPYLSDIPHNPYTNTNDITDQNVGASAWYYNETTGAFHANNSEYHRDL
ncbi:MAG: prepilin-type N-terminal cleavage/methylation domain-containing protein [Phycisphaeraceae bacterium]